VRHKHQLRGALFGVWLGDAAVIAWAPQRAPHVTPAGRQVGQTGDTIQDSLLVSDSVYQGWKWFHVYCYRCHGEDAIGGVNPAAPDLRWSLSTEGKHFPRDSFELTVLNGRLDKGMPSWKVMLDTAAVKELYQYVKARSDGWLKPGRPHRESDLKKSQ